MDHGLGRELGLVETLPIMQSTFGGMLPLIDYFRQRLGIAPLLFYGASVLECHPDVQPDPTCQEGRWTPATLEQLGCALQDAMREIERATGLSVLPQWETETVNYVGSANNDMLGKDGTYLPLAVCKNRLRGLGQRGTEQLGTLTANWIDADGDGWTELAEFKLPLSAAPDGCVQAYRKSDTFDPTGQLPIVAQQWEPNADPTTGGTLCLTISTLHLITPEAYALAAFSPKGYAPVDVCGPATNDNLAQEIDIWRVFVDPDLPAVELIYDGKANPCKCDACSVCKTETLEGCLQGEPTQFYQPGEYLTWLRPVPAQRTAIPDTDPVEYEYCLYKEGCTRYGDPDRVKIHYVGGCGAMLAAGDGVCQTPCKELLEAMFLLAAARMPWTLCKCTCNNKLFEEMQASWPKKYANVADGLAFVFGYKKGEVDAGRLIDGLIRHGMA